MVWGLTLSRHVRTVNSIAWYWGLILSRHVRRANMVLGVDTK